MKNCKLILATLSVLLISSPKAFSGIGNEGSGGGDLCEDQIQVIRSDIANWIQKGGHKNLKLPQNVNEEQYKTEMLKNISDAKIRCIGQSDRDYPVEVYGTPKVCRFDTKRFKKSVITCDREAFMKMNETNQYVLIHHEYAGLSNIEIPNKDDSQYEVSNQISSYLVDTIVKRLVVKPLAKEDDSVPIPFRGWRVLNGNEGVAKAKKIQDALATTSFKDCDVKIVDAPKPSWVPEKCEQSEYYKINFNFTSLTDPKARPYYNMPAGFFNCLPLSYTHYDGSSLASNNKNTLKNVIYANGMIHDKGEENLLLSLETIYEFDLTNTNLEKVSIVRSKIVDVNIGTITSPVWKKEAVVIHQLACNAE